MVISQTSVQEYKFYLPSESVVNEEKRRNKKKKVSLENTEFVPRP